MDCLKVFHLEAVAVVGAYQHLAEFHVAEFGGGEVNLDPWLVFIIRSQAHGDCE